MSVDSSPASQNQRPLFTVSNHHVPHSGAPPAVNGDEPGVCHGYFENSHGEQFVFLYRWDTGEAVVRCGDAGWKEVYPVTDGIAESLTLSEEEEIAWLRACWKAVCQSLSHRQSGRSP